MENFELKGRYKKEGKIIQFFNTGSGVSFDIIGRSVTFELGSLKNRCYVYIFRDFDFNQKQKILIDVNRVIRIYLQDTKPHHIDLVKANEALDNTLVLKSIKIDGQILKNTGIPKKFVKVYGDSTIAGYGILKHDGEAYYETNDGVEDFCFRALFDLKYDFDLFTASGWGITFSAYTNPKDEGIEKYQENLCVNSNEKWVSKQADLLIISLGINDYSYIQENLDKKEELFARFVSSYIKLIEKERKDNPSLPVLMIYGTLKEEYMYDYFLEAFKQISEKLDNVYFVKLPGDNSAISNHSYVSYHKKMAEILKGKILSIIQ